MAHLRTDCINFTNPVSLGFSSPRNSLFFITAINSRLLSWPSSAKSQLKLKLKLAKRRLTVFVKYRENHVDHVIAEIDVRDRLGHVLERRLVDRGARDVVEGQGRVYVVDVV